MNKPASLRRALNNAVGYLRDNPDKLHIFIDSGKVITTGASSLSWEYHYSLNLVIEDYPDDQNLLMAPIIMWLRENQPDRINNPAYQDKLLGFEVDVLRNDVCDISINLQLTERVIVKENGELASVQAVPEPERPQESWTVRRG